MKKSIFKKCLPILLVLVIMLSFICSTNAFAYDYNSKVVTVTNSYYYETPPQSILYDDGSYKGTLYLVSVDQRDIPYLSHPVFFATYTGTVYEYWY